MASRRSIRTIALTGAALGAIGFTTIEAQAGPGGFLVHEQSAYFQGTSFAGAAAGGPALSAMFWNPATITQHGPGLSSETNATAIFANTDIIPISATIGATNLVPLGRSGDIGKDAFVPASYYVYGLTDRLWFGLALNSPFGLRTQPNPVWAGMFYSRESEVFSLNANPTIAFKVTDWLSIGAGAQIQYLKIKLHSAFPGSGTFPPFGPLAPDPLRIDGDSNTFGFGFTAGVTITPTPWTMIGLGYRSRIDQDIEGDVFRPPLLFGAVPFAFVNFTATVPLPDIATASIRQKITESFTLLGTVEWQNWSRLGRIPVTISAPGLPFGVVPLGVPTELAFEWRDGWLVSVGAEYQWSPKLLLRGGVAFERSPVDDRTRGTRLPDNDRIWLSAGGTYNWNERLSLELAYSHIFIDETPINIVPGNPTFNPALGTFVGTANAQVDIISVALRYRWAPAPAAAPLITKG